MKKFIILAIALLAAAGVQAQSIKDILSGVADAVTGNAATENSIIGKWTYSSPAVRFESDNLLAKAGGTLMTEKIETKLAAYYAKVGIRAGAGTLSLAEDRSFAMTVGKRSLSGTYAFDASTRVLELKFTAASSQMGLGTLKGEAYMSGGKLQIVFAADKMLSIIKGLASISSSSSLSAISSIAGQYDGMSLGMEFTR